MLPVFLVGFFSALVSSFFWKFSRVDFGEMCWDLLFLGGFFDGSFFRCLDLCWVVVRKFVLLLLGFARNYLPECAPETFSPTKLVSLAIFNPENGLLVALC